MFAPGVWDRSSKTREWVRFDNLPEWMEAVKADEVTGNANCIGGGEDMEPVILADWDKNAPVVIYTKGGEYDPCSP